MTKPIGLQNAKLPRRQLLLIAGGFALPRLSFALSGADLTAVLSGQGQVQEEIKSALKKVFPLISFSIDEQIERKASGITLAVGPASLERCLQAKITGPIFSIFTSSQSYQSLVEQFDTRHPIAIFAEPSPHRQFQLIQRIYEKRVTVGCLLSRETSNQETFLRNAAQSYGLDFVAAMVESESDVLRDLNRLGSADVILALPDGKLYTPSNIRDVLKSTYRRMQPIVGFSPALVKAGTLATSYSSIADTVSDLQDLLVAFSAGRAVESRYPQYWRVSVNESVARSLDVVIPERVRTMGSNQRG